MASNRKRGVVAWGRSIAAIALVGSLSACGGERDTTPAPSAGPEARAEPTAAKPTPAPPSTAAAAGPVVQDPSFELRASVTGPYKAGQLSNFAVSLTGRGGWHLNQEFPVRIEVASEDGLAFPSATLERPDAAEFGEEAARFDVPFTAAAPGDHRAVATVHFAVCTDDNCIPEERTVAVVLPVEAR